MKKIHIRKWIQLVQSLGAITILYLIWNTHHLYCIMCNSPACFRGRWAKERNVPALYNVPSKDYTKFIFLIGIKFKNQIITAQFFSIPLCYLLFFFIHYQEFWFHTVVLRDLFAFPHNSFEFSLDNFSFVFFLLSLIIFVTFFVLPYSQFCNS